MRITAQQASINGLVKSDDQPLAFASVGIKGTSIGTTTNEKGAFNIQMPLGKYEVVVSMIGYMPQTRTVHLTSESLNLTFVLLPEPKQLAEVTVSGTLREVSKQQSPVPVEVYSSQFFLKNPTPNLFESLQLVNGVQPTINCNVCNTGDIRINGLDGPYTMVMIDGMPIMSALSTVYGLSGIPNSMIERVEIVKGPSSTLYGSEAVAGLINIITKNSFTAPRFSADVFATSYGELNADIAGRFKTQKGSSILSVNMFTFQNRWDRNSDGFMDLALQNRLSVFNKWSFNRPSKKEASIALRYIYENRYGGQMNFEQRTRGNDQVYGESIFTQRGEVIGKYALATKPDLKIMYSYNFHLQNSYYGTSSYNARQQVGFAQLVWNKKVGLRHQVLSGLATRWNYYDDNTPATQSFVSTQNAPVHSILPGVFVQDEIALHSKHTLLLGMRYDYYKRHGSIFSPRVNYQYKPNPEQTIRLSAGNGFRVVNLFTEDHQALSGARQVIIQEQLRPESSWNINFNYTHLVHLSKGFVTLDGSLFYTYFSNRIIADYDTDPNAILYNNLDGYAVSRGGSLNADVQLYAPLKINAGFTLMDVFKIEKDSFGNNERAQQIHAPRFAATYQVSYTISRWQIVIDYTAQVFGPMRLPILPNDFRPEYSPWYSLHNIQFTKKWASGIQWYGGVKNMFNFLPQNPIMRPFDPFDRTVQDTQTNPFGYTFDPSYNYAPMQGVRLFCGFRYLIK
ncbi:MAG: TonB-dependent receptor [Bacteroidia bacterium]|nr:TonB-dependent receptor [Bacteroidia bacterium]